MKSGNKGKDAEKAVNSGGFDRKSFTLCKFHTRSFIIQNKHINFVA